MKLNPYILKLNSSKEYHQFQKKHSDAFLVAGFFILDLETGKSLNQIDYYVPSKKKVAAFTLDKTITIQMLDLLSRKTPEKLDTKTKVDLESIQGILEDEMKNRNMTDEIKKIIAVVQTVGGKKIWNLNCILSGMSVLNAHLEDESQSILKMERKSLADIMRTIPMPNSIQDQSKNNQAQNQQISQPEDLQSSAQVQQTAPQTPQADTKEQIKKLEDLEAEIKKEKEALKKSASSSKKK